MPLGEAKAVLRDGVLRQWSHDEHRQAQRAWLDRCVPFSDVIEPVDQHEALVDLSAHPQPTSVLDQMISAIGRPLRLGVSRTSWLARVALEHGDPQNCAYHDPARFLCEVPTAALSPVALECRQRLEFLGYKKAGEVAQIPLHVLRRQFGQQALTIHLAATGRGGDPVVGIYPEATASERFYLQSPVECTDAIEQALSWLAMRLVHHLEARDLQSTRMRLWLSYEDEPDELRERVFAKPMQGEESILFAARMLSTAAKPVTGLRIQLPELVKASRKQPGLYSMRTDSERAVQDSIRQIRKLYGEAAVRKGSEIPLSRRQCLLRAWKDATGWA